MIVQLKGRLYRVLGDRAEVRIKGGQIHVMERAPRAESWRTLKPGKTRDRVLSKAAYLTRKMDGEK